MQKKILALIVHGKKILALYSEPQKILDNSFSRVYIPQYGKVECLNAAVAGSIAIYDWVRKNNSCIELDTIVRKFNTKNL